MTHTTELLLMAFAGLGCLAALAAASALLIGAERRLRQMIGKVQHYDRSIPSYLPSMPPEFQ